MNLPLESSFIFEDSKPIDHINQSIIDLEVNQSIDNIEYILKSALLSLDTNLEYSLLDAISSLIRTCLSYYPGQTTPFFEELLQKSKTKFNYFYALTYILLTFPIIPPEFNPTAIFDDCIQQILPQIQKKSANIKIYDYEIPPKFSSIFISNLLLLSNITKEILPDFSFYLLSQKDVYKVKIQLLIQKAIDLNIFSYLSPVVFTKQELIMQLPVEILYKNSKSLSEKIFKEKFKDFKALCLKPDFLNEEDYFIEFVKKSVEYNLNLDNRIIFHVNTLISKKIFNEENFPYLKKFSLIQCQNIDFYECYYDYKSPILSTPHTTVETNPKFWLNFMTVLLNSEKTRKRNDILKWFATLRYYMKSQNVNEIYDLIILNLYPLNHNVTALLYKILSSFSKGIRRKYDSIEHQKNLLTKVIEKRKVPHPQFWNLFVDDAIIDLVKEKLDRNENINPLLSYALYYVLMKTWKKYNVQLKKLIILPQNSESLEKVIDFNINQSLSYLFNIPVESLSLIIAAKFFIDSNYKIEIEGLDDFTTLLFYATVITKPKDFDNMKFIYDKIINLLTEDYINTYKDSPIFVKLIELIINTSYYFDYPLLKAFFSLVFNNQCNINKSEILKMIFRLSNQSETESINRKIHDFFNTNGLNIISFCLENLVEVNQLYKKKYLEKFNFNSITNYEVKIQIVNLIESKSNIEINQFIYFITNVCKNSPSFNINKIENNEKTSDDIYSLICANYYTEPIRQSNLFIKLFEYFMKEKSIAVTYYMILIENIKQTNIKLSPKDFLAMSHLNYFYKKDKDNFIEAFNRICIFNPITNEIVKKNQIDYITTFSEESYSIILKLLESINENSNDYQIFLVLKIIASTFPFLFTKNTEKIFEIVLSKVDEINSKETKYLSLSFLQSCLYSTKILNDFIIWLFDKILTFNDDQIIEFIHLLTLLFEDATTNNFKNIIISYITKFNFINTIDILLNKKGNKYHSAIMKFLSRFYSSLTKINDFDSVIIDELQNVENLVLYGCCFSITILPNNLYSKILNHIDSLRTIDDKIVKLWIFTRSCSTIVAVGDDIISEFISKINKVNSQNYIRMVRYFVHQPSLNQSININNIISQEQLSSVSNIVNDFQDETEIENIKKKIFSINCNKSLFKIFIKQEEFIDILCKSDEISYAILEVIKEECINYYTNYPHYTLFIDLVSLINFYSFCKKSNSKFFANYFNEICNESLIYIILLPKYRDDPKIIEKIIDLYSGKNIILPNCFLHLIDFVFLSNRQNLIKKIFSLFNKIDSDKIIYLSDVIKLSFVNILEYIETSGELILLFIKYVPNLIKEESFEILELLYKKYQNKERLNQSIIVELLCLIIPQRKESFSQALSEIIVDNSTNKSPKIIPESIFKTLPKYWEIFEHFYSSINHIKFNEICPIYPELFTFKERYSYLNQKLSSKRIKSRIELYIDRSYIVLSSFNNFERMEPKDFFKVPFVILLGEKGYDGGGLTRDWMVNLIHELFDPKSGYFILTENMNCFQPNPSCKKLEYFKFAGKIIAYVIMNRLFVNAHLSKPFLKQILHHKIKFSDLETIDGELYNSLEWIKNNDIDDVLDMKFTVDFVDEYGKHEVIELIKNGKNIKVTNQNKNEYINLMCKHYFYDLYNDQLKEFCNGFDSLIDHEIIRVFTSSELDLVICGTPKIDIEDFKKHTELVGYKQDSPTIMFFFSAISKWNQTDLAKLLIFVTGSSQVPAIGFVEYVNRRIPITINRTGASTNSLPVAHTCFNTIDIPPYESEEILNSKLILAVNECNDFGYI